MRSVALIVIELLSVAALLAGVAAIFWPAALILGGLAGVLACERAEIGRRRRPEQPKGGSQ